MSHRGLALAPSPNWYYSHVCDCNSEGILAFGSRHNVVIIDIRASPPLYQDTINAHSEKVTSLCFCKFKQPNLIATGSEDGTVKIWDISYTPKSINTFSDQEKVLVIEWQHGTDHVIFSADDQGVINEWNFTTNTTRSLKSGTRNCILSLCSNPRNSNLLAAGHKGGIISVFDVSKASVLYRLKGHEDDTVTLSWSYASADQLLSSSKDRTVRVWTLGQEKPTHVFYIPQPYFMRNARGEDQNPNRSRPWISAIWHPNCSDLIISSTYNGDIGFWNLKSEGKNKLDVLSSKELGGHSRFIFSIIIVDQSKGIICTISLDRQIVLWDLGLKKSVCQLSTLGGYVYDMAFSHIDTGRLAVGVGDCSLRIWNVASASTPYSVQTIWNGIKGKVTAIAWHPEREGIIAFGTDEGRVGIVDTLKHNKACNISATYHKQTVYTLSWGPCYAAKNNESENSKILLHLYSCGDGRILIHTPGKTQVDALNFDDLVAHRSDLKSRKPPHHTEVVWKPDYSAVAVGNDDGFVEIYSSDNFTLLTRLQAQKKLINRLSWHPMFTSLSPSLSPLHTWLACASNEFTIHVYNLTEILAAKHDDNESVVIVSQSARQLEGHASRVASVAWSPHLEGRLASASYDGTVQIWDVLSGDPLVNFQGHKGRVFSVEWNVLDPDIVFSGGEDFTVLRWRISEQNEYQPPAKSEKARNKKRKNKEIRFPEVEAKEPSTESILEERNSGNQPEISEDAFDDTVKNLKVITEIGKEVKLKDINADDEEISTCSEECALYDSESLPYTYTTDSHNRYFYQGSYRMRKGILHSQKKKKMKSLFPVFAAFGFRGRTSGLDDCIKLTEENHFLNHSVEERETEAASKLGEDDLAHLGYFGNQTAALKMLNVEADHHRETGYLEYALHLEVWKGNIGTALREASEKEQLNDWLLSLAPLASHSLWLEMCEKYASQLIKNGFYHKAAIYFLACHKPYEAIDVLKEKVNCRDALALAKVRLPSSDPIIQELLASWASKADKDANYELAAKCYLAQNQPVTAAKVLCKRSEALSAQVAAYICRKYGHDADADQYSLLCLKQSLLCNEWEIARKMINEQPSMDVFKVLVSVHESLCEHNELIQSAAKHKGFTEFAFPDCHHKKQISLWKSYLIENQSYLAYLYHLLRSQGFLLPERESLTDTSKAVSNLLENQQPPKSSKEVLFLMALNVTLYLITLAAGEFDSSIGIALKQLNNALLACLDAGCYDLLNTACLLFLPFDFFWKSGDCHIQPVAVIMQLQDADNCVDKSLTWLCSNFWDQTILDAGDFINKHDLVINKNYLISNLPTIVDKAGQMLSCLTVTQTFCVAFCINLIEELTKQISDKNLALKCYSKLPELDEREIIFAEPQQVNVIFPALSTEETSNISTVTDNESMQHMNESIENLLQELEKKRKFLSDNSSLLSTEIHSQKAVENARSKNYCMELHSPTIIVKSSGEQTFNNLQNSVVLSNQEAMTVELQGSKENFTSTQNVHLLPETEGIHNTKLVACDDSESELLSGTFKNESESYTDNMEYKEKAKLYNSMYKGEEFINIHSQCLEVMEFCFFLLHRISSCVLNDCHAVYHFLKSELKNLEATLASQFANQRGKKQELNVEIPFKEEKEHSFFSSDQNIILGDIHEQASSLIKIPLLCSTATDSKLIGIEKSQALEDGQNFIQGEETIQIENSISLLQEKHQQMLKLLKQLEAKAKKIDFPSPLQSAFRILSLCESIRERCKCAAVCQKLDKLMMEVTSWADKFTNSGKDLITLEKIVHKFESRGLNFVYL